MSAQPQTEFVLEAVLSIEGECKPAEGPWCTWHDAYWERRQTHCEGIQNLTKFAEKFLQKWEGRHS